LRHNYRWRLTEQSASLRDSEKPEARKKNSCTR
jgi:hypothetical protein